MLLLNPAWLKRLLWSLLSLDWGIWRVCVLVMGHWFNSVWIFWCCINDYCMLFVLWVTNCVQFDYLKVWVLGQSDWILMVVQWFYFANCSFNGDHPFIWLLMDRTLRWLWWFQSFLVPSYWDLVWIHLFWNDSSSWDTINLCLQRLAEIHTSSWNSLSALHNHHLHHSSILVQYALSHHSYSDCNHHLKLDWKDSNKITQYFLMDIPCYISFLVLDIHKPVNLFKHGWEDPWEPNLHAIST